MADESSTKSSFYNSNKQELQSPITSDIKVTLQPATPITDLPESEYISTNPNPSSIYNHGTVAISTPTLDSKRRISIASDPISDGRLGYDNLAFEQNPNRKTSQASSHSHSEIGPTRRKSILINTTHDAESVHSHGSSYGHDTRPNGKPTASPHFPIGPTALDSLHARLQEQQQQQQHDDDNKNLEQSWIYAFCLRCHIEDNTPSWEPSYWQKVCPYPLCPSFRRFSRAVSIIIIGILIWITAYVIIGKSAAPGGQLFGLVVLAVASHIGGWIISLTTLPSLIGMLLVGIMFTNLGWIDLSGDFNHVTAELRKIALTIILTRAGLEMEPDAFKKVYKTILKLGISPWTIECVVVAVMSHFLLELPWMWSFLLGSIIAAVSPAVVVPCLFRLRAKGYGVAKGIPTLIIAVSGIDDALSVALFGIINSIIFSNGDMAYQISQAPICILGGLAFGVIWGYMSRYIPEKGDPYVVPIRTLMLFTGGLVAIFGSEKIGYEGAGPLGVVFAAFISNYFWCQQGWEVEDNPVSTAFEIFWMIFEPILFGLTGTIVNVSKLDGDIVVLGCACLVTGIVIRIFFTAGIAFGDRLNTKEKFFVALSWMAKATVQAALGPVTLRHLQEDDSTNDDESLRHYAIVVQTVSVLSIILTAPLGAIIITLTGPKLLKKTKEPQIIEGWRRSHRPSMRDISIIDEEEEQDDTESAYDKKEHEKHKKHSFSFNH